MKEIAKTALKLKLGARGLRSILEIILTDIMYEAPDMSDTKIFILQRYDNINA